MDTTGYIQSPAEKTHHVNDKFYDLWAYQESRLRTYRKLRTTSWQIDGEIVEAMADFIFGGLQNHCRW